MNSSRDIADSKPRVFGVGVRAGHLVVHDPLTGRTHHRDRLTTVGRTRLHANDIAAGAPASAQELGGSTTFGVRWSPVVYPDPFADIAPTESPHRRAARALACAGLLTVDIVEVDPLCDADLAVIAGHLTDDGCTVSLTTGHQRLRDRADDLAECVDALRICVDEPGGVADRLFDENGAHHAERSLAADIRAVVNAGLPTQLYTRRVPPPPGDGSTRRLVELALSTGAAGVTFAREAPHRRTLPMPRLTEWDIAAPTCGTLTPLDIVLGTVSTADLSELPGRAERQAAHPG